MLLSILIPSTPKRMYYYCPELIGYLLRQVERCKCEKDVEVLWLGDNYSMSIGEKRNLLLDMAKGKYLVFIDDDDSVSIDYVRLVLKAIKKSDADAIVYDCVTRVNGAGKTLSKYSKEYSVYTCQQDKDGVMQWRGKVAHTMVWKSEIAKRHKFPSTNWEEDINWVKLANEDIKKEHRIDKALYYYRMYNAVSETRT